jgi:ABC-type proline/glycine betaine transport system permease subunit
VDEQPAKQFVSETVLEDKATHPAYMQLMLWTAIMVGILGGITVVILGVLAWFGKTVPDGLNAVPQWALLILGVLLVGEALLGKVTVARA